MLQGAGRRRRHARALAFGLTVLAPTLLLSACGPDEEPEPVSTPSSVVVHPGKPGEQATTVAPEDYAGAPDQASFSSADAQFLTDMIWHHDQAVELSRLAPERAASEQLKTFAGRIDVVQRSEVDLMSGWLEDNEYPAPVTADGGDGSGPRAPDHGHDAAGMPGMLTDAELATLKKASGTEFDRLFLEGMITHHGGALEMVDEVGAAGRDETVQEFAGNVAADQIAEIDRMSRLLDELAG